MTRKPLIEEGMPKTGKKAKHLNEYEYSACYRRVIFIKIFASLARRDWHEVAGSDVSGGKFSRVQVYYKLMNFRC